MGKTIVDIIKKPSLLFLTLGHRGVFNWMNDEQYLKIAFRIKMGRALNLDSPRTFNEKIQWLKLHDRKDIYTLWVDKYEAKQLAAKIIGEEYIIPTLGVYEHFDEINFDMLPDQFVLKCTHDSGGLVICENKALLDKQAAKKKLENCLKHNFFWGQREWPYKNVKPRIIAEEYMEDSCTHELRDYKFFTFDGVVRALFIATERSSKEETKFDFFDAEGKLLPFTNGHPHAIPTPALPVCFEKMKELASILGRGIPQVRVDFYEVNRKVYFGEMTFSHWSGLVPFVPDKWDYTFGDWIKLPKY